MADVTLEDIKKMSDPELAKTLNEAQKTKITELIKLLTHQTHEQKIYKRNKKIVAQIKTEMRKRTNK